MSRPRRRRESEDGWGGEGIRGYMAAKKRKLYEQFETDAPNQVQKEGTRSNIFNGVVIYVNGWTDPPADELRRLMQVHGGKYDVYPSRSHTTHVVASNLPDRKIKDIRDKKVVRPQWITDSIKAGQLLSHVPYMLYRRDTAQGSLNFRSLTRASTAVMNDDGASMDEASDEDADGVRPTDGVEPTDGVRPSDGVRPTDGVRPSDGVRPFDGVRPVPSDPHGNSFHGNDSLSASVVSSIDSVGLNLNKSVFKGTEAVTEASANYHGDDAQEALGDHGNSIRGNSIHGNSIHGNSDHGNNDHGNCASSATSQGQPLSKPVVTSPSARKPMGSSKDANFVAEFYDNSRLHHLSTWRTEFQTYVNVLQGKGDNGFPGRQRLRDYLQTSLEPTTDENCDRISDFPCTNRFNSNSQRGKVVMHLDMDCFFVSVGLRNHPELRGKPVAVTHSKGKGHEQILRPGMDPEYERFYWEKMPPHRHSIKDVTDKAEDNTRGGAPRDTYMSFSEIASCSYEARQAGVKNGMFMGPALKLCPDLKTIPYDFQGYKEVAQQMYNILASYTHEIEAVSCDEAFVDVTDILANTGATPDDLATVLRQEILEKTQCPASVGLASSILLARMATKRAKPNGQFYLPPEDVLDFVSPQMVRELPGVGRSLESRLKVMGVVTCGDLQQVPLPALQKEFGPKTGQALHRSCRGQDDRGLKVERERKSVSAEINYGIRFTKDSEAETFMYNLAEEVQRRLQKAGLKGKTVTVKVMARKADAPVEPSKFMGHGICDSLSKSSTLGLATDDPKVIGKEAWSVLSQMKLPPSDLRGLGIQMTRLVSAAGASSSSASNKSIMDFVKAKPATAMQRPSTCSTVPSSGDITELESEVGGSTANKKTMLDFLKPSMSTITEEIQEETSLDCTNEDLDASETSENTTKKTPKRAGLPPLPMLPSFKTPKTHRAAVPGRLNEGASSSHEDLYLPSPSQVDPSVLAALPEDIRQQIEQTYAARNLPLRHDAEGETEASDRESPPGIDQSFLDALPPDLRREIEEEQLQKVASESTVTGRSGGKHQLQSDSHRAAVCTTEDRGHSLLVHSNRGRDHHSVVTDNLLQSTEPVAGPSDEGRQKKRSDSGPIVALPDLNKIDPTCLDALPPELQQELKRAYAQQQRQQQPIQQQQQQRPNQPQDALKLLGQSKGRPSPPKAKRKYTRRKPLNSPSKRKATVGTVGSPAKKRLSPQKLVWNQTKDNVATMSSRELEVTPVAPVPDPAPEAAVNTCDGPVQVQQVHLCGRVELPEVKELLKEWTHTCPVPEEEDVDQFIQYLHQLILDRNLETVDLLIKYIRRLCKELDTSTWGGAVEDIIGSVQRVMEQLYGGRLKVT